jgi:MoaA/NifB/PqqE/SkfB family radical SAM enzyme
MPPGRFAALVDEAVAQGFTELYLTGGEPLLHPDIAELLGYATTRLPTVLLTNAMLLRGHRADRLRELTGAGSLVIQTSLDGARPDTHDAHRGPGSFTRTVEGIRTVVDLGFPVRVALTETDENSDEVSDVAALLAELGVPKEEFAVRPLLRRGFSDTGADIGENTTVPELTVSTDGLHWHPAGADADTSPDMLLVRGAVPLAEGQRLVVERFFTARLADGSLPAPYRCAI